MSELLHGQYVHFTFFHIQYEVKSKDHWKEKEFTHTNSLRFYIIEYVSF